ALASTLNPFLWPTTAASNDIADSGINWSEGQSPGTAAATGASGGQLRPVRVDGVTRGVPSYPTKLETSGNPRPGPDRAYAPVGGRTSNVAAKSTDEISDMVH